MRSSRPARVGICASSRKHRASLTALGIWLLIMSGCAAKEPDVPTPVQGTTAEPAVSPSKPTTTPTSAGQPTQRPLAKPQRTNVSVVVNGDLLWHNSSPGFSD